MAARVATFAIVVLVVVVASVSADFGMKDKPFFDPSMIETALRKFYTDCNGENWPADAKRGWNAAKYCAFDGNERGTPAPSGTRCAVNGAWHKLPPHGDGGLMFLEHLSGMAKGQIPDEFKSFQAVIFINLRGNKLYGPLWNTSYHQFMQRLDLSNNEFSGELHPDILSRNREQTELLNLGGNKFTGKIPESLGLHEALTSLSLNNNEFSGPLPDLSHATNLRHLNVAHNKLTGEIGPWLKELKNLAWLEIEGNGFTGKLPDLPAKLSRFTASGNKFSGEIPRQWATQGYLRHFDCTGCDLTCPEKGMLNHVPFSTHCQDKPRQWG